MKKKICYKNWKGQWIVDSEPATKKRLDWIKQHKALNGQATIQII